MKLRKHRLGAVLLLLAVFAAAAQGADHSRAAQGYIAQTPDDWKISRERDDGRAHLLEFGLPNADSVSIATYGHVASLDELVNKDQARIGSALLPSEAQPAGQGKEFMRASRAGATDYKSLVHYRVENGLGYAISLTAKAASFDADLPAFRAFLGGMRYFEQGQRVAPLGFTEYDPSLGKPTSHAEEGASFDGEIEVSGRLRVEPEEGTCKEACAWFEPDAASLARLPRPILEGNTEPYRLEAIWLGEARPVLARAYGKAELDELLGASLKVYSVPVTVKLSEYSVEITCDWAYFRASVRELRPDLKLASRESLDALTTC